MAEDKKEPRHKKMYKDSPKLERNKESGKMGITKGEKKSAEVDSGTDGMPEHEKTAMEMGHKHEKEHLELNQKHEKERHALRSKQMMDMKPEGEAAGGESKETEGSGGGQEKIEKVEKE